MAFDVRIEAYKFPATTPMFRLEASWWNADELMREDRFKYEPEMAGYDDYVARLSVEEFAELHRRYRDKGNDGWQEAQQKDNPEVLMLDGLIEHLNPEHDHVIVTVFEWGGF